MIRSVDLEGLSFSCQADLFGSMLPLFHEHYTHSESGLFP